MRALVIGAGLSGLAAVERLLDAGAEVVCIDAFPVPGGRVASFDVTVPVAGLVPGDVVEHGLHAWFQHYHALFGLMGRASLPKPAFAGRGIHFFHPGHGHTVVEGGPLFWLLNSLRLPEALRGPRAEALRAFGRLILLLESALAAPESTDRESAAAVLVRAGVPPEAIEHVFRRCLFSLTSLPLERLSALEFLRWMANIIPDPRIRCIDGGGTAKMAAPIVRYLEARGADVRLGIEVTRLRLEGTRVRVELAHAPDRTGVRHLLAPSFRPPRLPDVAAFDAIVCTLPPERLLHVSRGDPAFAELDAVRGIARLEHVRPLTVRLWFERPIEGAAEHYVLSSGTVFDVLRPTREPGRGPGVHLIDALVDDVESHLPGFRYDGERFVVEPEGARVIEDRVLEGLELLYPGRIRNNRVLRRFLHTREGIIACRPGAYAHRPPQHVGLSSFVLAGDYTRHPFGVCMEGAVRSGQLAVDSLVAGRQMTASSWPFRQAAYSLRTIFERS